MAQTQDYPPATLVIALLLADLDTLTGLEGELSQHFGPLRRAGAPIPFSYTQYYQDEMGHDLTRVFLTADKLYPADRLAEAKQRTNRIESRHLHPGAGGRQVNLDPGLLLPGRFILATTKEAAHRIPLSGGMYAELTLLFQKGDFRPLPWTYPDYRSEEYRAILRQIRAEYVTRLRRG